MGRIGANRQSKYPFDRSEGTYSRVALSTKRRRSEVIGKIRAALEEAAVAYGAPADRSWHGDFYQLGNRLAHLYLLRKHGVRAWLVLVNFMGDREMRGPAAKAEWEAAYDPAIQTLGIAQNADLLRHVVHVYLDVGRQP